jgi:hypothetical protein
MHKEKIKLLVGDNPFHGISHLSQERARNRFDEKSNNQKDASELVKTALQNGASGFMFSVSETTLGILKSLDENQDLDLYAIVPYAYEYVRLSTKTGGVSGLAKKIFPKIAFSSNLFAVAPSLGGLLRADPKAFLKAYVVYEMSRIKSAKPKKARLKSVLLHEIITDMALALDLRSIFEDYIDFMQKRTVRPGFETRNFSYLVNKFEEWDMDFSKITLTAPFNSIGFQMNPSKAECEKSLGRIAGCEVVAMSILAAGYLKPEDAANYLSTLQNITHVVVGVSKKTHAQEGFRLFDQKINGAIAPSEALVPTK